jgi:hypothetical protein
MASMGQLCQHPLTKQSSQNPYVENVKLKVVGKNCPYLEPALRVG